MSMKFPVNLASQPFRRDRPVLVASAIAGVLLVVSLIVLISLGVADRHRSSDTRSVMEQVGKQVARTSKEQARLDAVLRQPDNAEVLQRSVFLNALLYRKGISWTRVFADLEKTVPHNVRIINIRPQVVSESQVYLEMMVGSETPEPVVELFKHLEQSDVFSSPTYHSFVPPSRTEPLYRYRVSVNYAQKL
jgi:type IV pilus assembly protein PilN